MTAMLLAAVGRREFFATAAAIFTAAAAGAAGLMPRRNATTPGGGRTADLAALLATFERADAAWGGSHPDQEMDRRTIARADALDALTDGIRDAGGRRTQGAMIAGRLILLPEAYVDEADEPLSVAAIDPRRIIGLA